MQLRKINDGVDGNTDYQQVTRNFIHGSFYFLFTVNELLTVKWVVDGKTYVIFRETFENFRESFENFRETFEIFRGTFAPYSWDFCTEFVGVFMQKCHEYHFN